MRLLTQTIRYYFFYSFLVFLVAIPLFYFIIKRIVEEDVDKDLITQKEEIVRKLDKSAVYDLNELLDNFGLDIDLFRAPTIRLSDTLYTIKASNKMLLVYLYKLFPSSPYLLPSYFEHDGGMKNYVKKPVYSREGANVSIIKEGIVLEAEEGDYGQEGFIYQQYEPLPRFENAHAVIGSWLAGGRPAGMGIRESSSLITNNSSRFCPHYFIKY